jgi:hypothetical protein
LLTGLAGCGSLLRIGEEQNQFAGKLSHQRKHKGASLTVIDFLVQGFPSLEEILD